MSGTSYTLTEALASAFKEANADYVTTALPVENVVTTTSKYVPLLDVHSVSDDINGFQYDKTILSSSLSQYDSSDTFVDVIEVGFKDGISIDSWISGVRNGIAYHDTIDFTDGFKSIWTPRVKTGSYTVYSHTIPLFSDYSLTQNADTGNTQYGLMYVDLNDDVVYDSIFACIYERSELLNNVVVPHTVFQQVEEFTGELSGGSRLTVGTAPPNAANIAARESEFMINTTSNRLYFNGQPQIQVGDVNALISIAGTWEDHGFGQVDGRSLFLRYFPVQDGSVTVVTVAADGSQTTWTESYLGLAGPSDNHYEVDYDLGVIRMGGYQAETLVLAEDINASATVIKVHLNDRDFDSYADRGTITIGTEQITYQGKGYRSFFNCTRGANATVAASHTAGDIITDNVHGAGTSEAIFVKYTAVPRLEYELTESEVRTANRSTWIDLKPTTNVKPNSILQIASGQINVDSLVLETDEESLGGTLFGPVYYGTDVARLTATALDSRGNPVDDIPVTFFIQGAVADEKGSISGAGSEFVSNTNTIGESYSLYNAPYGMDQVSLDISSMVHNGADTEITVNGLSSGALSTDVWLFQVLKHGDITGTQGFKTTCVGANLNEPRYALPGPNGFRFPGLAYFDVDATYSENYRGGTIRIKRNGTTWETFEIADVEYIQDSGAPYEHYMRVWVNRTTKVWVAGDFIGEDVFLVRKDAQIWNSTLRRGDNVIVYEWNASAEHPLTGATGAYTPVHPDTIAGDVLTYSGRNLPLPAPTDPDSNLGNYIVIAPSEIAIQAYCKDPFTGNLIYSNTIRFKLQLPAFLTGVDYNGIVPVPKGWTLPTESFNVGSGLGGANFFTINPKASLITQFAITGNV